MNVEAIKNLAIIPAVQGFAPTSDLQFYVGQDLLKIKSVDTLTGVGFTVAYLRPTVGDKDPVKRELALFV